MRAFLFVAKTQKMNIMIKSANNLFEVIVLKKCCICQEEKKENLIVAGKAICAECEWKILTAHAHTAGYNKCIRGLRSLFAEN